MMRTLWRLALGTVLLLFPQATPGVVLVTTDAGAAAAFATDTNLEDFEGLTSEPLSSYDPGQSVAAGAQFNSRGSAAFPTFNSGGGTPSDPVGNPGAPIGIVAPSGGIAGDVVSGTNVAAPLVIFTDEPWNNAFLEVIFPFPVDRVGFWVTHGAIDLQLRDATGNALTTGDVEASASKGEFVGISRGQADIVVAALIAQSGQDAFTIDDFVSSVPEPAEAMLWATGGALLAAAAALHRKTRHGGS